MKNILGGVLVERKPCNRGRNGVGDVYLAPVILSEVAVRNRTATQSKDPYLSEVATPPTVYEKFSIKSKSPPYRKLRDKGGAPIYLRFLRNFDQLHFVVAAAAMQHHQLAFRIAEHEDVAVSKSASLIASSRVMGRMATDSSERRR